MSARKYHLHMYWVLEKIRVEALLYRHLRRLVLHNLLFAVFCRRLRSFAAVCLRLPLFPAVSRRRPGGLWPARGWRTVEERAPASLKTGRDGLA